MEMGRPVSNYVRGVVAGLITVKFDEKADHEAVAEAI